MCVLGSGARDYASKCSSIGEPRVCILGSGARDYIC